MNLTNKSQVNSICRQLKLKDYQINDDLTVDVNHVGHFDESVKITRENIVDGKLPIKFNKVKGGFEANWCGLTTLEGSPKWVGGNFQIVSNKLTTLEHAPGYVGGGLNCRDNNLTTLKYSPKKVGHDFNGYGNGIGDGFCLHENNIRDLEDFDCDFAGEFMCVRNPIQDLLGNTDSSDITDYEFVCLFKRLKVIKSGKLDLKRFKYLMSIYEEKYYGYQYNNNLKSIISDYEII